MRTIYDLVPLLAIAASSIYGQNIPSGQLSEQLSSSGLFAVRFEWKIVAQVNSLRCELTAQETGKLVNFSCSGGEQNTVAYYGVLVPVKFGTIPGDTTLNVINSGPGLQDPINQIGLSARELATGEIEVGVHGNLTAQYFKLPVVRSSATPSGNAPLDPASLLDRTGRLTGRLPVSDGTQKMRLEGKKKRWWNRK